MSTDLNQKPQATKAICELTIDADAATVWRALVEETHAWWLKDFYTRPNAVFRIEPRVGGRMFEDQGDGNGLVWGNVIGVDPHRSLDIQGYLTQDFGGPALSYLAIRLEEADAKTRVSVTDTIFGFPSQGTAGSMEEGWLMLFEKGLKAHVERTAVTPN